MEDSKGFVCLIHLFHLPSNYSEDDLLTLYPPGGYFGALFLLIIMSCISKVSIHTAIKEPQVREMSQPVVVRGKQTFADSFVIRLESPGDIIRLSPSSAYVKSVNWGLSTTLKVEELIYKVSGNDHFAKGEWLKAFAAYTRVLEGDPSLRGRATVLARSNRAQTLLNLKRPGAALRDCAAALLDPYLSHKSSDSKVQAVRFKIHYRAALAEYQLGRYTAALTRLEFVRKDYPKDTSILELIARTEERVAEANTGIYKWRELFSTFALDPEATLDIADYTGSMITHATVPGKGRGLIATRDIVPGELLLVSRPLASATAQKDALKFLLGVNLYAKMMDSSPNVNLIALLIEKMEDDPSIIPLVYDLHPGDSFSPHGFDYGSMKAEEAIDISRLEGITIFNSFHPEHLIDKTSIEHTKNEERDRVHQPAALYYYPSFMNHSCIGNVTYSFISDTIFMRCREPIKAGEELLDSYVDPMSPLKERQETFTSHGFVCNCQLCQEDQQDSESSKDLRVSIGKEIEETTYSIFLSKEPVMTREILEWIRSKSILFRNSYGKNRKFRPEMYKVTRLLASSLERVGLLIPAIELETEGLEILGGKITKSETGKWTLVEAPKMGDVNSVLSALFIAKQYAQMDKLSESK